MYNIFAINQRAQKNRFPCSFLINTRAVPKTSQKHSPIKRQHKSKTTSMGYAESSGKTAHRKGGRKTLSYFGMKRKTNIVNLMTEIQGTTTKCLASINF